MRSMIRKSKVNEHTSHIVVRLNGCDGGLQSGYHEDGLGNTLEPCERVKLSADDQDRARTAQGDSLPNPLKKAAVGKQIHDGGYAACEWLLYCHRLVSGSGV